MNTSHAAQAGQGGPVTIACINKATVDLGVPFDRLTAAPQGIEFAEALFLPGRARHFVDRLCHSGFDKAGADGVDANIGLRKLLRGRLDEVDDSRLRR